METKIKKQDLDEARNMDREELEKKSNLLIK